MYAALKIYRQSNHLHCSLSNRHTLCRCLLQAVTTSLLILTPNISASKIFCGSSYSRAARGEVQRQLRHDLHH